MLFSLLFVFIMIAFLISFIRDNTYFNISHLVPYVFFVVIYTMKLSDMKDTTD
jgi:hypothetical protein